MALDQLMSRVKSKPRLATTRRLSRTSVAALAALIVTATPPASAQDRGGRPPTSRKSDSPRIQRDQPYKSGNGGPHDRSSRKPDRPPNRPDRGDRRFGPLAPGPEDFGPLQPGEADELLSFSREAMPQAYDILQRLKERSPREFQRRMQDEFAPRLRALQRVFSQNPRLGRMIVAHADNLQAAKRAVREYRTSDQDAARRERIERELRRRITDNFELEARIMETRIAERSGNRDRAIDDELQRLQTADVDTLADEPPRIRKLVEDWKAAAEADAADALARLRDAIAARFDQELSDARDRLEMMRTEAPRMIEVRLQRMLEFGDRPPPGDRPPGDRPPREP
jgi:hypothetical protein